MADDLIRLMHGLFMPAARTLQEATWHPPADVYQTPDGWLVKFDLAGIRPEDITVSVAGPRLTIKGTRRDECRQQDYHCYRMEIAYSSFERSLDFPCNLERTQLSTEYRQGMLLICIRTEEARV